MWRRAGAVFRAALAVVVLFGVTWTARAHAAGDLLSKIRARGELRYGADVQGGEPYVFEDPRDPAHGVIGFEVELAATLAKHLGVTAKFSQADWSNLVPALERGDFDVALNGLEDTPARRARILVSRPYFVFGETLAVAPSSTVRSLDELAGRRVGTLNQSYGYEVLRARGFLPVLYEGVFEPYADLALGRTDGVLLDHIIADRYGCNRKDVHCLPGDVVRGRYVVGVPLGEEPLRRAVDVALGEMEDRGELRTILERWKIWDERQLDLSKPVTPVTPFASGAAPSPPGKPHWTSAETWLFLQGALVTLGLSLAAFFLALPLGLGLALVRLERGRVLGALATVYIEVFRGTPLLLQLYVLYYGLAPIVRLGPITAAIAGLALNYAAYEAELHRGAILAVPRGQSEAARSLGLGRIQTLRHVLLPQSFRIALPAMTNDFVALLKDSSLVSVLTVVELTKRMTIAAIDLRSWVLPGVACAALYFAMSYPLSRLAQRLERRLDRERHAAHA